MRDTESHERPFTHTSSTVSRCRVRFSTVWGHEADAAVPMLGDEKLVRSDLLERFPYRVYYYVDADDLFVIALLHGRRRRPGLYRGR